MAVSSKNARNITVGDVAYRWRATGNDGWISLVIWPQALPGARIAGSFGHRARGNGQTSAVRQLVITNRLVRRVLEHVLAKGYYWFVAQKSGQGRAAPMPRTILPPGDYVISAACSLAVPHARLGVRAFAPGIPPPRGRLARVVRARRGRRRLA